MPRSGSGVCVSRSPRYARLMTHSIIPMGAALLCVSACVTSVPALPDTLTLPGDYSLVWADEFEQDGLPEDQNWAYDTQRNAAGWWNDELQYYGAAREKNARVEDGRLIIEAHNEPVPIERFPDTGGQSYTSARLFTKGKTTWQYGYFEVRAKLPCGRGLWPAIWTLPEGDLNWPDDGEIDIMEYRGQQPNLIHGSLHGPGYSGGNAVTKSFGFEKDRFDTDFHIFAVEWGVDYINFFVDDTVYKSITPADVTGEWVYDHPFHIILNLAVGGDYVGFPTSETIFPQTMLVDWVRVYQEQI